MEVEFVQHRNKGKWLQPQLKQVVVGAYKWIFHFRLCVLSS